MDADLKTLIPILLENRDKQFVQRILKPEDYPTLDNKDGSYSTHSMAWSGGDGSSDNIVYPTVVQDKETKEMKRLSSEDAYQHAVNNNEYIRFDTPDKADWFSKNYKQYWDYQ